MLQANPHGDGLCNELEWCGEPGDAFRERAYRLGSTPQRLANIAIFGSRESLEEAFRALATSLPEQKGVLESMWVREKLRNECSRAAVTFHQILKCGAVNCRMPRPEVLAPIWNKYQATSRFSLLRWTAAFLIQFDEYHKRIGVPVRTGKLLRRSWRGPRQMDSIARKMGISRSAMEGWFEERYGLTPKAYHMRVRLRAALLRLHLSTDKVEYVARQLGYTGLANFYTVFERYTGLTPTQVRELDLQAVETLLDRRLEISLAKLVQTSQSRIFSTPEIWSALPNQEAGAGNRSRFQGCRRRSVLGEA